MLPPTIQKTQFLLLTPRALLACLKYGLLLKLRPVEVLNRVAPAPRRRLGWPSESDISRAVYLVSRLLPGVRCLPQAFAVRELMHRYGRPCELRMGVAVAGGFRAHAWVESSGQIVHGQSDDVFVPLGGSSGAQ